jgi:hypothetical protein
VVWFNSIILLDDVENSILRGLKFLDTWVISGVTDTPGLWMSTEMTGGISHADLQPTGRNALFLALLMPSPFPAPLFSATAGRRGDEPAARCQCLASGLVRDGRFFRSGPASLRVYASPSPF